MNAKLKENTLFLSGDLDENIEMSSVKELIEKHQQISSNAPLKVDFSDVKKMNSCGIFEWITIVQWSKSPFHYVKAPWWLLLQINMNFEFLGSKSVVASFFADFYCPEKDLSTEILLEVGVDVPILEDYEDFEFKRTEIDGAVFEPDFDIEEGLQFISNHYENYDDYKTKNP